MDKEIKEVIKTFKIYMVNNTSNEPISRILNGIKIIGVEPFKFYKAEDSIAFMGFPDDCRDIGIEAMWKAEQEEPFWCIDTFEEFRKAWLDGSLCDGILLIKKVDLVEIETLC